MEGQQLPITRIGGVPETQFMVGCDPWNAQGVTCEQCRQEDSSNLGRRVNSFDSQLMMLEYDILKSFLFRLGPELYFSSSGMLTATKPYWTLWNNIRWAVRWCDARDSQFSWANMVPTLEVLQYLFTVNLLPTFTSLPCHYFSFKRQADSTSIGERESRPFCEDPEIDMHCALSTAGMP